MIGLLHSLSSRVRWSAPVCTLVGTHAAGSRRPARAAARGRSPIDRRMWTPVDVFRVLLPQGMITECTQSPASCAPRATLSARRRSDAGLQLHRMSPASPDAGVQILRYARGACSPLGGTDPVAMSRRAWVQSLGSACSRSGLRSGSPPPPPPWVSLGSMLEAGSEASSPRARARPPRCPAGDETAEWSVREVKIVGGVGEELRWELRGRHLGFVRGLVFVWLYFV